MHSQPSYTDTRYNDKIFYNDSLTVMKLLLKRWQLFRNYAKILYWYSKKHRFWLFVRIASPRILKISKTYVQWENKNKIRLFIRIILGPVVQSVVSLTSSLRVISLTVLVDSIYNTLIFFAEKMWVATHIFSAKNFSIIAFNSM